MGSGGDYELGLGFVVDAQAGFAKDGEMLVQFGATAAGKNSDDREGWIQLLLAEERGAIDSRRVPRLPAGGR